jgi:hypothetical protein
LAEVGSTVELEPDLREGLASYFGEGRETRSFSLATRCGEVLKECKTKSLREFNLQSCSALASVADILGRPTFNRRLRIVNHEALFPERVCHQLDGPYISASEKHGFFSVVFAVNRDDCSRRLEQRKSLRLVKPRARNVECPIASNLPAFE